jgi:multifunctional beta-oxidation protein
VIPQFGTSSAYDFSSFVPNFNPTKLLHGEQYLKLLKGPLPTSGTLTNHVRLREVLDKGKAAMVTVHVETRDKATGEALVESQSTVVLRGSGGFGGKKNGTGECLVMLPRRRDVPIVMEEGLMYRSRQRHRSE